jgi:hypothetical protein
LLLCLDEIRPEGHLRSAAPKCTSRFGRIRRPFVVPFELDDVADAADSQHGVSIVLALQRRRRTFPFPRTISVCSAVFLLELELVTSHELFHISPML